MLTYTYRCSNFNCKHEFETQQRITDKPLTDCPECGEEVKRIITPTNFILKGEKWFRNSGEY